MTDHKSFMQLVENKNARMKKEAVRAIEHLIDDATENEIGVVGVACVMTGLNEAGRDCLDWVFSVEPAVPDNAALKAAIIRFAIELTLDKAGCEDLNLKDH